MDALVVLFVTVGLAAASLRWGYDSRSGVPEFPLYDDVAERLAGMRREASLRAMARRPGPAWHRRALVGLGAALVALGGRLQAYGESVVVPSRFAATSDGSIQSCL